MSHYAEVQTQIKDLPCLLEALKVLGFKDVEVHEEAQPLVGYGGDLRRQTAEVIIRRKHIGAASNDIGFKRMPDETFQAIISEFDQRQRYGTSWLGKLKQEYGIATTIKVAKRKRYSYKVQREGEQARVMIRVRS